MGMSGLTLDTGALTGFERGERRAVRLIARARERGERLAVPAGVIAQAWRDGRKQVRLVHLLGSGTCDVVSLDDAGARAAGQLCGVSGTTDVIDASVVVCARARGHRVATADPGDLLRLDPRIELVLL